MKTSDYIITFLADRGVTDIFGYPGGCINHLIDSAYKNKAIRAHLSYNEQGAAFAACGYAQKSGKLGVAYSTSGPGATNLITGIASAYFDSTPALFITGQVDSPAEKGNLKIRQRGFQETDVVACVTPITKWAYHINNAEEIKWALEKAYSVAFDGNPGPVLLDIPNDFQRADIDVSLLEGYTNTEEKIEYVAVSEVVELIEKSKRPVVLAGNGVKQSKLSCLLGMIAERYGLPVVSSLASFDLLPYDNKYNFGFIGTNGHRYANFIADKADLIIVLGNRMSIRPLGIKRERFAPNATIIRVDVDIEQLNNKIRDDEIHIRSDLRTFMPAMLQFETEGKHRDWIETCDRIKDLLKGVDFQYPNAVISKISELAPSTLDVSADIGQNLVWLCQSYKVKEGQTVSMSAGNGPMGYSIPSGIGSYFASGRPVISFCGDGGLMMNVQELEFIRREHIPNKIICINNSALGMIRSWQARYLDSYSQTTCDSGYGVPDIKKIADAFDLKYTRIDSIKQLDRFDFEDGRAELLEVIIPTAIDTNPNGDMHDQSPKIDRELYNLISNL